MENSTPPTRPEMPRETLESKTATRPVIASEDILKGSREVLIRHADVIYRLCLTKNGKLILQK